MFGCPDAAAAAPRVISQLETALDTLCAHFPYLAGRVTLDESTRAFVIRNTTPHRRRPTVVFRDRTKDDGDLDDDDNARSWEHLTRLDWPQSLMSESIYSPVYVNKGRNPQVEDRDAVLTIQVTALDGALAVNVVGHHQVMDGTGQERVTWMLHNVMRRVAGDDDAPDLTDEEIRLGSIDRRRTVSLLDDAWQPLPNTPFFSKGSPPSMAAFASPSRRVNIRFTQKSAVRLKRRAAADLLPECPYISTDDALVALIWTSVARARGKRLRRRRRPVRWLVQSIREGTLAYQPTTQATYTTWL